MKLIRIDTQKPIAVSHFASCLMEQPTAQTCFRKINRIFFESNNPVIPRCPILDDFPRLIHAAGIEHIDRVGPGQEVAQALTDDVGFVAHGEKADETHINF